MSHHPYPHSIRALMLAASAWAAILAGCILAGKEEPPQGSEIENELGARIFLADGSPAAGATIRVYPVDHRPVAAPKGSARQSLVFTTRTDSQGRYQLDSLPRGEYNILSERDGEVAFQDSVFVAGRKADVLPDTLRAPGVLVGRVRMQAIDDPRSVIVQVLGTNTWSNVDDSGVFALRGLGHGAYRLRFESDLDGYTPTFADASVRSGRTDTLRPDLVMTFTGIPVVEGLAAAYDTSCGCASLHWNRARYSSFGEYMILRKRAGEVASPMAIDRSVDTAYTDTVYRAGSLSAFADRQDLEYRVAIVNKADFVGRTNGSILVRAASPKTVRTSISVDPADARGLGFSIHDTVPFVAKYSNEGRRVLRIRWYLSGSDQPVRETSPGSRSGEDTLRVRYDSPGSRTVRLETDDEGGVTWSGSGQAEVVRDEPVPFAVRRVSAYAVGEPFNLRSGGRDKIGKIVSWEWDVGANGKFTAGGPDTTLSLAHGGLLPVVLRVTDDDTNRVQDTLWVTANARPRMVLVPAGTVTTYDGRTVAVAAFRMQNVEVTKNQWYAGELATPADSCQPISIAVDEKAYCNRRSRLEGLPLAYDSTTGRLVNADGGYRLPTAEEWQYAAQAGKGRLNWEWEDPDSLETYVWYAKNSGKERRPVGWKAANAFGLYDMAGNMAEKTEEFQPDSVGSPTLWSWRFFGGTHSSTSPGPNAFIFQYPTRGEGEIGFRVVLPGGGQ
jgi:sulfatase modifying factor 1